MGDGHPSSTVGEMVVEGSQWGECLQAIFQEQKLQDMKSSMQLAM